MDVRALWFLLAIALTACTQKTTSSVFDSESLGSSSCSGQALSNRFIVQWESGEFTVETAPNATLFKSKFIAPNLQNIRKVEYDRVVHLENTRDQNLATSTAISLAPDSWGQDMVEAEALWNKGFYGQNVLIGVIDSFVDVNNAQLASRIQVNENEIPNNGLDDDGNNYVDDYLGHSFISNPSQSNTVSDHGSHVTGIIAADHDAGPIKGIAPKAKIIPAPFIDGKNGGSIGDAILAMQYASARGARIINASWGGAPCMTSLRNAFVELNNRGVLVVVAAGNEGIDLDYSPDFPAAFNLPNQITVAAANVKDYMPSWSNRGFSLVHLAAPGVEILSTLTNNRVGHMDGTSMAAPFVSGAAALLWSAQPTASLAEIKNALLRSVDVTRYHEYKVQTLGRLNISKALQELQK